MTFIKTLASFLAVLACFACFSKANAQVQSKQQIETAVETLKQAMLKPDASILNKLSADELTYGHSSGKIESKKQFVETLVSGASVFKEINLKNQTIQTLGNTAVVRHILEAKTDDPGKGPADVKIGIVLTWVKIKGQWQLLARQAFKVS